MFFQTPGTADVSVWLNLVHNTNQYGIIGGYEATADTLAHPPGMGLISFISSKMTTSLGLSEFMGIKVSVYVFLLLTLIIIYVITKNYYLCIVSYLLLMINSLGLVYLDIYFTPFLILGLFFF